MVWLPLSRADQNCVGQLDVLPLGPAHWKQEGAVRGEFGELGGGGDGQCQGSGHSGRVALLYGSAHYILEFDLYADAFANCL